MIGRPLLAKLFQDKMIVSSRITNPLPAAQTISPGKIRLDPALQEALLYILTVPHWDGGRLITSDVFWQNRPKE